jgi:flagellar biosynthesis/type III secretory pathway protein FliH
MGYIVKAKKEADASAREVPQTPGTDRVAAEVMEVLLAARIAAESERAQAKHATIVLARKMAERIVGHAVDIDPDVMADIVSQAVRASRPRGASIVLRVHPDDLPAVRERQERWQSGRAVMAESGGCPTRSSDGVPARAPSPECTEALPGCPCEVRLIVDETVGRYGCVVDTPVGRVDARLETQLDVLERVLGGSLRIAGSKEADHARDR